tara:strand:+ start:1548 stop:1853 length:306 start_codon:yes stop_codon:yes gene_type:complete
MKKTIELSTKRKVAIKDMSIDEVDECQDMLITDMSNGVVTNVRNMSKARTAWLRKGIAGGDFKSFKKEADGNVSDSVLKQLTEDEKNELSLLIQEHQKLGE